MSKAFYALISVVLATTLLLSIFFATVTVNVPEATKFVERAVVYLNNGESKKIEKIFYYKDRNVKVDPKIASCKERLPRDYKVVYVDQFFNQLEFIVTDTDGNRIYAVIVREDLFGNYNLMDAFYEELEE